MVTLHAGKKLAEARLLQIDFTVHPRTGLDEERVVGPSDSVENGKSFAAPEHVFGNFAGVEAHAHDNGVGLLDASDGAEADFVTESGDEIVLLGVGAEVSGGGT